MSTTFNFPFSAVAGQAPLKLALILAAINPSIGGVLVSGPRGCAKSTLARGFADVLPGEHPFVTLPLGATEEMLVGTLDLQRVLDSKELAFNPGLLAKAHKGVLYVDEVNLLPDMLVDLLLDVAASGVNRVERDGISHSHPAQLTLLGTMNPDEGELRPQLQDRFGLAVELDNQYSIDERMDIVRLREAYDRDPQAFLASYLDSQQALARQIKSAQQRLSTVQCSEDLRRKIADACCHAQVDGLRADIVWYRAALAHAAWQQRDSVTEEDIDVVEELVLAHRRKHSSPPPSSSPPPPPFSRPDPSTADSKKSAGDWGSMDPVTQKTADPSALEMSPVNKPKVDGVMPMAAQKKGLTAGGSRQGKKTGNRPDWFATLLSSAAQWPPKRLRMRKQKSGLPVLHLVLLDTSASTLQGHQFGRAKAAILSIAKQAYLDREQICIMGFGNQQVDTLMPQVKTPKDIRRFLDQVTAAGGTPLREVIQQAQRFLQQCKKKTPGLRVQTYLVTDGKTTQSLDGLMLDGHTVMIDIESSAVKRGKGRQIAQALNADYYPFPA